MRRSNWPAFGLLLLALPAMAGPIYKWVDRAGQVHYSDTPQPGWEAVDLRGAAAVSTITTTPGENGTGANGEAPAPAAEVAAASPERCAQKKRELASYQSATSVVERDIFGKERTFSGEERSKLIELTQREIERLCAE
jgi:hypothetical protein